MRILWLDLNCSYSHCSLALPVLHAQVMHRPIFKAKNSHTVHTTYNLQASSCAHARK